MATDGPVARAIRVAGLLAFGVAGGASAQLAGAPYAAPTAAPAQAAAAANHGETDSNGRGGWSFVPTIRLRGTATDNVDQAPDDRARSDFITEIMPGIRIDGNGKRVKLHLDYRMDNLIYARDSSKNDLRNYLNAFGSLEAVEHFLFVDARAAIDQEAISPFGPRPTDITTSANRTETRTYQVSPYIQGRLVGTTSYLLRYDYTDLHSTETATGDERSSLVTGRLRGETRIDALGWNVEATSLRTDYENSRDTQDDRARGVLIYAFDPQFHVNVTSGYERNNYLTLQTEGNATYGVGFEWAPTPRSKVFGNWEHRFFGDGWYYGANSRSPYLVVSFSDKRDVTTDAQSRIGGAGYTAAYNILFDALATRIPDPIDRAAEAQRLLASGNIPNDLGLPSDFLVGNSYIERRQDARATILGVRNTLSFGVYRLMRNNLVATGPDIPPGTTPDTREWGASANLSHKITPFTTFNVGGTWRETASTSGTNITSKEWTARVGLSTQFGPRTTGSLEYHFTRFISDAGASSDYRENELIATLYYQF
jgi:uncharacterized protein (PEP-CTERM system associated)